MFLDLPGKLSRRPRPEVSLHKREFAKNTLYSMVGFGVSILSSFVFTGFAGRMLGVETYGIFYTFFSFLMAFNQPINSLQLGVARYTSLENGHLKESVKDITPTLFTFTVSIIVLFCVASPFLAPTFNLPGPSEVILGGIMLAVWLLIAGYRGIFQGRMDFKSYGINIAVEGLLRGAFGVLFIAAGFGIAGAVGASIASVITATVFLLFGNIRYYLRHIREFRFRFHFNPALASEFGKALLALLPLGIMMNIDLFTVEHTLGKNVSGYLSICSLLGKNLITLALVIANVVFSYSLKHREKTFWFGLALTGLTFFSAWGFLSIFGQWVIDLIGGSKFIAAVKILPLYVLFCLPLGIMQNIVNYAVAKDSAPVRVLLWIFMALTALLFTVILHQYRDLQTFLLWGTGIFSAIDAVLLVTVLKTGKISVHG
jgi:O-antigen/teichoic acid export membrane protein